MPFSLWQSQCSHMPMPVHMAQRLSLPYMRSKHLAADQCLGKLKADMHLTRCCAQAEESELERSRTSLHSQHAHDQQQVSSWLESLHLNR